MAIITSRFLRATVLVGISTAGSILQAEIDVDVGGSGCCGNLGGGPVVRVTILGECNGDDTTGLLGNICAAG